MDKKKFINGLRIYINDCKKAKELPQKKIDKYGWAGRIQATQYIIETIQVFPLKDVPDYLVDIANLEYQGSNKSDCLIAFDKCAYDVLNYYADYIKENLGGKIK